IYANERFEPDTRARVSILRDRDTKNVTVAGPSATAGSSFAALRAPTLADALRARHPDAVILGPSLKDRGAIFAAGRKPTAAVWFDVQVDAFVTSTVYANALPGWALPFARPEAVRAAREAPWRMLDEGFVRAHAKTPDDQAGEGDLDGFGVVFP